MATARADVQCTGAQGPNPAEPEFYQEQYNPSVADQLTQDLQTYNAAVASGDPQQIGQAAGTLYSEISTYPMMFSTQTPFGCYNPLVLTNLQQPTNAFATTLDNITSAAASIDGKTPNDVPGLVSQAEPQETAYINALNAYASQFGGEQVPQN